MLCGHYGTAVMRSSALVRSVDEVSGALPLFASLDLAQQKRRLREAENVT